ncbi:MULTISPECIES: ribonuclease E/G [unclassified Micromonospora]|uniref:ribonuclease E/G n=1 Tax=unclassified Micromonospora TaxID=2617518 RepID=UPI001128183E|nr:MULTISPECIES: ribonuclease E/G [unclassified Micromonospora]MCK1809425.1 Rne/Rng family ribonuclease [Micromonospora sp. R42106]MCK1833229.1 Rne/Rng family ribonuclease [Micromonospora sp. R42003]MCM1020287.1 Rne/Rng family ribonuclease [Micromonospora sp. XM-20-01]
MLENEPEGGERTGAEPTGTPADNAATASGSAASAASAGAQGAASGSADDGTAQGVASAEGATAEGVAALEGVAETKPPARKRASRRKAAPLNQPEQTDAPVEASTAATGSGESPQAEVLAPIAGELDTAPKTTRRRRKATPAKAVEEPVAAAGVEAASEEVVPPVKVTRTRRRKATPPAAETVAPDETATGGQTATDGVIDGPVSAPGGDLIAEGRADIDGAEATAPGQAGVAESTGTAGRSRTRRRAATADKAASGDTATATGDKAATGDRTTATGDAATTGGSGATAGDKAIVGLGEDVEDEDAEAGTVEDASAAGARTHEVDLARSGGPADATGVVSTGAAVPRVDDEPAEPTPPTTRRRRAALSAPTVLFMAPQPDEAPAVQVTYPAAEEPIEEAVETGRRRRRARREVEPVEAEVEPEVVEEEPAAEAEESAEIDEDDETAAGRRRRRRGRRGRGRGKGGADEADDEDVEEPAAAETAEDETEESAEDEEPDGEGMTRRRRRRRRRGAGEADTAAEDGVPTVVKIREPRKPVDEVQGVSGSTRLEAKRQRRRDGREQRRTRPPILSESEFLARREAVDRVMVVRQRGDRTQIAVLEDGVLVEHYVTRNSSATMAGNVYLGKVQNVLPSMEAAFVDIGRGRNAVLYAGEVNWDATGLEGRARSIEQALRSGDSVLVQVTKDPIGHKGARLTSHIALSGRHLVYVPNGNASGISRKLPDTERKRLRDALKKLVPDGAGVIVRTAAEGASEDELARDVKRLQAQWEDIQAKATEGGAPVLLYEEPDLVIRVVRDLFNEDFRELVIEGESAYDLVESYLSHVSPDLVARLRRHAGVADVFAEYRIDEQILKGLDRKVFLPSGGSLVIDRTEAMTVIDVNTGKYTGSGGNLEETVTRNNLEAAEEIVRQLRLRDLGGIVVIDFIDMVLESNRELVLRRLTECLGRDRTKHQVTEITSLGLVQMTRKRIGAGLLEAFSETCECCKGRGVIIHTEPVPEKPRGGAGEKVKAVASAVAAPAEEKSGRRRGRKAAAEKPAVEAVPEQPAAQPQAATEPPAAVAPPERTVAEVVETDDDYYDTQGYDLSRFETDTPAAPAVADSQEGDSARLAAADDPDAIGDGDSDDDSGAPRRRTRRGGARRRTRP